MLTPGFRLSQATSTTTRMTNSAVTPEIATSPYVALATELADVVTARARCPICNERFRKKPADAVLVIPHERGQEHLHARCVTSTVAAGPADEAVAADAFEEYRSGIVQRLQEK